MLLDEERQYVEEIGSTILKQIKKDRRINYWGIEEGRIIYAPYYIEKNLLSGSLVFNISTEKYSDSHYVRVIYNQGSDSYIIQVLHDKIGNRELNDFELVNQIDREYAFGLVNSIDMLI